MCKETFSFNIIKYKKINLTLRNERNKEERKRETERREYSYFKLKTGRDGKKQGRYLSPSSSLSYLFYITKGIRVCGLTTLLSMVTEIIL